MPVIVGVKFRNNSKLYYFDPKDMEFSVGEKVIVETTRGVEYATIAQKNTEVKDEDIKGELKPIIRKADYKDDKQAKDNLQKEEKAYKTCLNKIEKHNLNMKLINAEYTFDKQKVIFNFTADGRVDFRELVKDLAAELRTRIELHQVYEKDGVILRGAMGMCGRECCCISCPNVCDKSSVKMAKNQNMSLNPTKINGMCGKLMCCLRFENDFYVEMLKKMPKVNAVVQTKDGDAKVLSVDLLREYITASVQIEDSIVEKRYNIGEFKLLNKSNQVEEDDDSSDELVDNSEDKS